MSVIVQKEELDDHFKGYLEGTLTTEKESVIMDHCIALFKKDYSVQTVHNDSLCSSYPKQLIIIQATAEINNVNNAKELEAHFKQAHKARTRERFPVPVLCYNGKNLARSATLAHKMEVQSRSYIAGLGSWMSGSIDGTSGNSNAAADCAREEDIELIKAQNIYYICDLMVEDKKQKYGVYVTSSEKVDKFGRYADFCVNAIPYPGTEFFYSWKAHNYQECMPINWAEFETDSTSIDVDPRGPSTFDQHLWKEWNIVELTCNYLKQILSYLALPDDPRGVLVHCISGWDRTPLYISLIRLSLWADGEIHQHLTPLEMLYLTVNYDWNLFCHDLPKRVKRSEDVFYFCFVFLKYIVDDDFSMTSIKEALKSQSYSQSQKIAITKDPEMESAAASFGDCGRSWEFMGGYMRDNGSNHCSFLSDTMLQEVRGDRELSFDSLEQQNDQGSEKDEIPEPISSNSDDFFGFEPVDDLMEEESEFCVLPESGDMADNLRSSCDASSREARLMKVQEMMLDLYRTSLCSLEGSKSMFSYKGLF